MPPRSATVEEGVALLKRGTNVTKYGRSGKPHSTMLKLSDDERRIGWDAQGLAKLRKRGDKRTLRLCEVSHARAARSLIRL